MKIETSEKVRHAIVHASGGDMLPEALVAALAEEAGNAGWVRGSGVLESVELRTTDGATGASASPRRLQGPVHAVLLEGAIAPGALRLRGVFSRETDAGPVVLAGELLRGRVVSFEAHVVLLEGGDGRPRAAEAPATSTWSDAVAASADAEDDARRRAQSRDRGATAPLRPAVRRATDDEDGPMPEAGDVVEHFAFGRADVIKSDGDRLHLRVHKDGRIREIALEMLRVTPLAAEGDRRRWRLERKL